MLLLVYKLRDKEKAIKIQVKASSGRNHPRSWYAGKNKPDPALDRDRPKFYIKDDEEEKMFLANWAPVMKYLRGA